MEISSTMSCRAKSRINVSFTVRVRGVDVAGKDYEEDAVLDNLSASGLYVRLPRNLEIDAEVFTFICLSSGHGSKTAPAGVAASGVVVRSEPQLDGSYGVAINFKRYRLL